MRERSKRSGFTLIELLVVIAIISLLVSILLPSLSQARNMAKSLVCATGLRNLGLGVFRYTDDHNGALPVGWIPGSPWAHQSAYVMSYYAAGESIPPGMLPYNKDKPWMFWFSKEDRYWFNHPYNRRTASAAPNFWCPVLEAKDIFWTNGWEMTAYSHTAGGNIWKTWRVTDLTRTDERAVYQDMGGGKSGHHIWTGWGSVEDENLQNPHMGGSNFLFVDGHAAHFDMEELREYMIEWDE
jgi:prepilin-type N-terminal cleavage/methylation domain-containing protein/prepilin-type processing-associated H-X9-DG protein